jgi:hypothetical protein
MVWERVLARQNQLNLKPLIQASEYPVRRIGESGKQELGKERVEELLWRLAGQTAAFLGGECDSGVHGSGGSFNACHGYLARSKAKE